MSMLLTFGPANAVCAGLLAGAALLVGRFCPASRVALPLAAGAVLGLTQQLPTNGRRGDNGAKQRAGWIE